MLLSTTLRQLWLPCAIACAIGGSVATNAAAQTGQTVEFDRIVAIVNDDIIALSELEAYLGRVREQLRQSGTAAPPPDALRKQVLERLIYTKLQLQLAANSGIRIGEEALNQALRRIADQNGLTLRQFRDALQRDGYDYATFREDIRDELKISEVRRRQVESQVTVSNRDIENYMSTLVSKDTEARRYRYRIGHILTAVPDGASPDEIAEAREQSERILAEIRGGADFASMAVTHSDGQLALEGGEIGWREASELPTLFGNAVILLDVGEIAGPIRSPSGFHLVKLLEKSGTGRKLIEQTHARHILVELDELTDETAAKRQLTEVRERILNGEDFGELARVHSDDSGSSPKGGDLGWIDPGNTVSVFERTMDSLETGELSEPFKSPFGWHIVQVLERREHDDTEAARRAEVFRTLRSRKVEERLQTWIRRMRNEAYVEIRLDG